MAGRAGRGTTLYYVLVIMSHDLLGIQFTAYVLHEICPRTWFLVVAS